MHATETMFVDGENTGETVERRARRLADLSRRLLARLTGRGHETGGRPDPWVPPSLRWLTLTMGSGAGLATAGLLWFHDPDAAAGIVAVLLLATAAAASRWRLLQGGGYLLGLAVIGVAVAREPGALLAYVPWVLWGGVVFADWWHLILLGTLGLGSFLGALALAGWPLPAGTAIVAAATVGIVHGGIVMLGRALLQQINQALTDPLTGLPNRRHLRSRLEEELSRHHRSGAPLALIYLDLDHFKRLNDIFGHRMGDRTLVRVAEALRKSVRAHETVARVGGDEFVILLPGTNADEAGRVAARMVTVASRVAAPIPLDASAGWVAVPDHGVDAGTLIDRADAALYARRRVRRMAGAHLGTDLQPVLRALPEGVAALVRLLDTEAVELEEHLSRVASLCMGIGSRLSLDDATRAGLVQAALVHDLGKLAVPRDLLMKPSALTREEQPVMRGHVSAGVQLLRAFGVSGAVVGVVAAHHERWDGTGYPAGLAGEAIPLEARILAVADAYEAMTAGRPYHAPRSPGEALAELRRQAGSQFDPRCVQACFLELAATQEPAESTASA